nr:hypothetical protein [Candidatus Njordarchaeota archaeon]
MDFKDLRSHLDAVPTAMAERLDETDKRCWSIAKHNARMWSALIVGTGPN